MKSYYGFKDDTLFVSSESYPLTSINVQEVQQVFELVEYDMYFNLKILC